MNLIVRVLMAGPIGLGLIAAAFFAGGYVLQVKQNEAFARNAIALAEGRPDPVSIEDYSPDLHRTEGGEVHVRAQMYLDAAYELTIEEGASTDLAFMVPLLATDTLTPEVIGVALWRGTNFDFALMTNARLMAKTERMGAYGPVVRLNGYSGGMSKWDDLVEEALNDEGLALPSNAFVVYPYIGSRASNLPTGPADTMTMFGIFSKIGGAFVLLALLKLVFRGGKPEDDADAPAMATAPAAFYQPTATEDTAMNRPADSGVPLWKQRLDARSAPASDFDPMDEVAQHTPHDVIREEDWADADEDFAPKPSYNIISDQGIVAPRIDLRSKESSEAPAPSYGIVGDDGTSRDRMETRPDDPLISTPRRGFSLHKLLIGLVGVAFVLCLVAILQGLLGEAMSNERTTARVIDPAERAAQAVADSILPPDAVDPDRPIYQIDLSPVARWFIVKGLLAWSGDTAAMMTLGFIAVSLVMSLFMLRYYVFVRSFFRFRSRNDFSDLLSE